MKNTLVIVSLLFTVQHVQATKARVLALANSPQIIDEQSVFTNINNIHSLDPFISLETGVTSSNTSTTNTSSNAEGLVGIELNNDDKLVVALGHQDEAVIGTRLLASQLGNDFLRQQNPVYILWGHKGELNSYGAGLFYSNYRDRVTGASEASSGINLGLTMGAWRYSVVYTFVNSAETALNTRFDGAGTISAHIDFVGDTNLFYLKLTSSSEKSSTLAVENSSNSIQLMRLGLTDSTPKDTSTFFWGAEVASMLVDCRVKASATCKQKYTSTFLPVWLGLEAQLNSWFVLRGSVKQTVLINQSKDEVGYPAGTFAATNGASSEYAAGQGTTTSALGAGLMLRNVTIDGLLAASTTQSVNSANLLTQLGLKYSF